MRRSAPKPRKFYYLVLSILLLGVLLVYDASPLYAQSLGKPPYYFALLQLLWSVVGLILFGLATFADLKFVKTLARGIFLLSLALLGFLAFCSIFFPCSRYEGRPNDIPFCPCKNGARRWLNLNPSPLPQIPGIQTLGFQVTDLAKLALVIYLPVILESKLKTSKRPHEPFVYLMFYTLLSAGLVLVQPNMSNAILIIVIGLSIYFVSGAELKPLLYATPVLLVIASSVMLILPHTRRRVISVFRPHQQSARVELYQSEQILIGLGAGGLFGVGVGRSMQKHSYTPELPIDAIFAIIGEEMGFIGSVVFIAFFGYFCLTMVNIVSKSVTLYEKMVGTGVVAWIFFQYAINLYSTLKLITPTGIPLPFVSYGGSSMVFSLAALGLVSNIYRRQ